MYTIKITPNLLFEYQCTSGKFIRLPNRIESKLFLPELECSTQHPLHDGLVQSRRPTDAANMTQQAEGYSAHDDAVTSLAATASACLHIVQYSQM